MSLWFHVWLPDDNPEEYCNPVEATLYSEDQDAIGECEKYIIGSILADQFLVGTAEIEGMPMYYVLDCDEWGFLHERLFTKKDQLRASIGMNEGCDSLVIIYRCFLAPCLRDHQALALHMFMQHFSCYTIFIIHVVEDPPSIEVLKSTTGIETRGNQWDSMTYDEKLKAYYGDEVNSDDNLRKKREHFKDESQFDQFARKQARRGENMLGGKYDKSFTDLFKPKDTENPFQASNGPFGRIGEMIGGMTAAMSNAMDVGIAKFADPEKAAEERMGRGSVSYLGLQDLQKNVQMGLDADEQTKDKLKLELSRKQLAAAERTADRLKSFPSEMANQDSKLIGLQ